MEATVFKYKAEARATAIAHGWYAGSLVRVKGGWVVGSIVNLGDRFEKRYLVLTTQPATGG